uniref:2-oxoacid dehydrogenase acyltransferase catalytic domain-containing protein n=1 Tax=Ditylenchus dipsaci TaxID=166011 RepID=A0A915EK79_9BILA
MLSRICNPVVCRAQSRAGPYLVRHLSSSSFNQSPAQSQWSSRTSVSRNPSCVSATSNLSCKSLQTGWSLGCGRRLIGTTSKRCADHQNLPNHTKVALPALSPTMEMGTIEGAKDIPIGKLLCIIVENQDDVAAFKDFDESQSGGEPTADKPSPAKQPEKPAASKPPPQPISAAAAPSLHSSSFSRVKASPYAKKLAAEQGLNYRLFLDLVQVEEFWPRMLLLDIPLSNMRKTIAKRLCESKSTIPHYYLTSEILIDNLLSVRAKLNSLLEKNAGKVRTSHRRSLSTIL